MARDPFAPVTQPSIPPWIWIVGGTFALIFIVMGATMFVVMSRRSTTPTVATPSAPTAPAATDKAATPTATASAAPVAAPDKAPDKADAADKADGDRPHRGRRHRSGKGEAVSARPAAAPSSPSPAPKKKSDMSQKEIDGLLGL
jgi:hypothetical protein